MPAQAIGISGEYRERVPIDTAYKKLRSPRSKQIEFNSAVTRYLGRTIGELEAILADPKNLRAVDLMALRTVLKAALEGDIRHLEKVVPQRKPPPRYGKRATKLREQAAKARKKAREALRQAPEPVDLDLPEPTEVEPS